MSSQSSVSSLSSIGTILKHSQQMKKGFKPPNLQPGDYVERIPESRAASLAKGALKTACKLYSLASVNVQASDLVAKFKVWYEQTGKKIVILDPKAHADDEFAVNMEDARVHLGMVWRNNKKESILFLNPRCLQFQQQVRFHSFQGDTQCNIQTFMSLFTSTLQFEFWNPKIVYYPSCIGSRSSFLKMAHGERMFPTTRCESTLMMKLIRTLPPT